MPQKYRCKNNPSRAEY